MYVQSTTVYNIIVFSLYKEGMIIMSDCTTQGQYYVATTWYLCKIVLPFESWRRRLCVLLCFSVMPHLYGDYKSREFYTTTDKVTRKKPEVYKDGNLQVYQ